MNYEALKENVESILFSISNERGYKHLFSEDLCFDTAEQIITLVKAENNRLEKPVMPKIAEIYSAMGYLFNGGEFPDWLNEQEIPLGAIKEYEEAKQWFDENIKSNFTA